MPDAQPGQPQRSLLVGACFFRKSSSMGGAVSCGAAKVSAVAEEAGKKIGGGEDSVVLKLTENQLEEFRECFNAFDKDGGGSIDAKELGAPRRFFPRPHASPQLIFSIRYSRVPQRR